LQERVRDAVATLQAVRERWNWLLLNLDLPLAEGLGRMQDLGLEDPAQRPLASRLAVQPDACVFNVVQDHTLRVSWKTEVRALMERYFAGADCAAVLAEIQAIHDRVLRGRVFVALHMHAGDGNVHTNIPVNSDDYEMLREADRSEEHT